ncbi:hypothetical protein ACFL5T_02785 [Gemmatimonadota bacterium]
METFEAGEETFVVQRIWLLPRKCIICGRWLTPGQRYVYLRHRPLPGGPYYYRRAPTDMCPGCANRVRHQLEGGLDLGTILWGGPQETPDARVTLPN